jgi:hypothetical protein
MRTVDRSALGLAVVAACALAAQMPAQGAPDNTPPVLHTPLKAHFVVGSQLTDYTVCGPDEPQFYVPEAITWSATDNGGGPIGYTVWEYFAGADPDQLVPFQDTTSTEVRGTDYDDQCGGGSFAVTNWSVQASDFQGNSVERAVYGSYVTVLQDDGSKSTLSQAADVSVHYTGSWQTSNCGCFAGGTTHKTTDSGAAARIDVSVPATEGVRKVGLVMETAPGRGKARVLVDGVSQGTIDTVAASPTHQVVVWQGSLTTGNHVVRLVNLATPGRPRIDLDAVVVN